jgi:Predicted membrane protein (DUF2232)
MMRALAGLIVAGPLQAVGVIALFTVLSFLAPPLTSLFSYVGAAALALYSLHTGAKGGLLVLLGATLATAALGQLVTHQGLTVAVTALLLWLPVWIAAGVLRATVSLAMAMLVLVGLAMLGVLVVFIIYGDPAPWWQQTLQGMVDSLVAAQPELGEVSSGMTDFIRQVAPLMTGAVASGLGFAALTCLMLGRWWQSLLVKPGALRTEFYALRLNGVLSLAGIAILVLAYVKLGTVSAIATQWALIAMVVFFFVGLAVLHATLANLKAAKAWLIAAYILMSLLPQALLMVVVTGLLDPWMDLRRRTARA